MTSSSCLEYTSVRDGRVDQGRVTLELRIVMGQGGGGGESVGPNLPMREKAGFVGRLAGVGD